MDAIATHTLTDTERVALAGAARQLLALHGWVRVVYLYGSAARGGGAHDIDIGIVADPIPTRWDTEILLAAELHEATGIGAVPFDVRIVNHADPVFLGRMLTDAVLLAEATRADRVRFEVRAMSLWLDFKPVWERIRAQVLQGWSHG